MLKSCHVSFKICLVHQQAKMLTRYAFALILSQRLKAGNENYFQRYIGFAKMKAQPHCFAHEESSKTKLIFSMLHG